MFSPGTFIISNHADELTAWTPLLAYLNQSAFVAIPCCSHDLSGARFRAPISTKNAARNAARLPQQDTLRISENEAPKDTFKMTQQVETGSLKRSIAQKKMASAYSSLCSYVTSLAEEVGFEPEKEVLRIPSTRNQCIIGRKSKAMASPDIEVEIEERNAAVSALIERETGRTIASVARDWMERAEKLTKKPGSGH